MITISTAYRILAGVATIATIGWTAAPLDARSDGSTLAIVDATIFDATGREPYRGTVVVRDGRIADVGPNVRVPVGASIVRADGKALLPGFFDVHTHWSPAGRPATTPQIASAYVSSGVTTVNDFHQQPESFAPRRAWLRSLAAPHVNFVARMSTPGGHGADWGDVNTTKWVATAESARREVRALQIYRPDYIKAFADGWRYGTQPEETSMNAETLGALVDEAHRSGQKVLTHTVTVARGKVAAAAGVDVIGHSLQDAPLDADAITAIKKAGTFYAPTLAVYEPGDPQEVRTSDAAVTQRLRKWAFAKQNLKSLYDAGVIVAVGTDAGIGGVRHGYSTLHEMELMVSAGLPAKAALMAGTANSATALGLFEDRGTIEKGKRADLVLLDGKPWERISDVHKTDTVFIDGRAVVGGGMKLPPANAATALAPSPAAAMIDDFERADGRSALDTLRLADMDGGVERSSVVTNLVPHERGRALAIAIALAPKAAPEGGIVIPLRRGSVQPVDATRYSGIRLDLRGDGPYVLVVNTLSGEWTADVAGTDRWADVRVPFTALVPVRARSGEPRRWRGDDLLQVGLVARRAGGTNTWAEVDNVRFF